MQPPYLCESGSCKRTSNPVGCFRPSSLHRTYLPNTLRSAVRALRAMRRLLVPLHVPVSDVNDMTDQNWHGNKY